MRGRRPSRRGRRPRDRPRGRPDFGPAGSGRWPEELVDAARLPVGHDWGYAGTGADGQPLAFDRAAVIGGCSSHNACAQSVGRRGDYDRWAASGCDCWSGADLESLFDDAVRRMRVRSFEQEDVQPFQAAFLAAAVEAGVPRTDDLDDLDGGIGCAVEPMNVVDGVRWNAAFAYLDPVRERTEILGGALVDRVLLEHGRAVGVLAIVDGRPSEFSADLIVLGAGVRHTGDPAPKRHRAACGPRGSRCPSSTDTSWPDDVRPLVALLRWAGAVARSEPLARHVGEPLESPPQGDADLREWIRSRHTHYWHPAGS